MAAEPANASELPGLRETHGERFRSTKRYPLLPAVRMVSAAQIAASEAAVDKPSKKWLLSIRCGVYRAKDGGIYPMLQTYQPSHGY